MENKLFKDELTLEEVEKVVNEYVEGELLNIKEKELLEKWGCFSVIFVEKQEVIDKFLEMIKFIDALSIDKIDKIRYTLTLCYLVLKEKMDLTKMDLNNIYMLVVYLDNLPINDIKKSVSYLNNEKLLLNIRLKSLDLDVRVKLLRYVDSLSKSVDEALKFINDTEYYEMLNIIA